MGTRNTDRMDGGDIADSMDGDSHEAAAPVDGDVQPRRSTAMMAQDVPDFGVMILPTARAGADHPAAVYIARLAPGSRRTIYSALERMAGLLSGNRANIWTLHWAGLRYQHTAALRALLATQLAPATTNKYLAALRGVLKEAWRLGQMSAEDYRRAADLPSVRAVTLLRGRALEGGELQALFRVCAADRSPAGRRDAALLSILYGAGLRRSEAVALDAADYDPASGALTIRAGKGRKARVAYAGRGTSGALEAWLQARGAHPGALFCSFTKSGRVRQRRMSDDAVRYILQTRAREAGVQSFSPHDLRRSFIGDLLDAGADISTVQRLAGHANVATTSHYDRRGERAKRRAADLLHVPFSE